MKAGISVVFLLLYFFSVDAQVLIDSPSDTLLPIKYPVQDSLKQEYVKITSIVIAGNAKTKRQIIMREMDIKEGETYLRSELIEILKLDQNKVFNTRLFVTANVKLIDTAPGLAYVLIDVTERWYIFPIPIFKLADRNFNDWWVNQNANINRVEYGIRFNQDNLRGMNERLRLTGQLGFTRQLDIAYSFPYITSGQKLGLNFGASYSENNSMAYRSIANKLVFFKDENDIVRNSIKAFVSFSYREAFYNTHTASLEYNDHWIADTVALLNPDYFLEGRTTQKYFRLRYEFKRDLRDVRAYPLRGFLVNVVVQNLGLGLSDDINKSDILLSYEKYFALSDRFYASTGLRSYFSTPSLLPYNEFRGLGYNQNALKGYELYVVEGNSFVINKLNLKFRLAQGKADLGKAMPIKQFRQVPFALFLKGYIDHGYVNNNASYPLNERLINAYLFGYGLGIDYVSFYDSVVRLEYSLNRQGDSGFFLHFRADL